MESYVIHIYRQGQSRKNFVGTVEKVGQDGKRAFTTLDELWEILTWKNSNCRKQNRNREDIVR